MKTNPKIAFIFNAFPVLSETFIRKEVVGLRERGIDIKAFSLFDPKTAAGQNGEQVQSTYYLLPTVTPGFLMFNHLIYLLSHPVRYFSTFFYSLGNRESEFPIFRALVKVKTDPQNKVVRQDLFVHFILAVPLARQIQQSGARLINAQFADAAASFAMLTSRLLNVPYAITMHAYDIFVPQFNMSQKLKNAVYIFTCTKFNKNYLLQHRPTLDGDKIKVVYHGIDVDRFVPTEGTSSEIPVLLSVGRLVPKKGFFDLLKACLILKRNKVQFCCKIVGNGPLKEDLASFINENDLTDSVELLGSIPHSEMINHYKNASAFVLPCVVEGDGNRDGIPNVIAEAMAMELPVVTTTVSGIPELVINTETGILIDENQYSRLAEELEKLLANPERAGQMGKAGRKHVEQIFNSKKLLDILFLEYNSLLEKMKN